MPGMDGFGVVQRLAALPAALPRPQVIMLTAHTRELASRRPEHPLVASVLMKPVNPSLLFNAILRALGAEEEQLAAHKDSQALTPEQTERLAGAHVLLVEDNSINQQVGKGILAAAGVRVTVADDGQAALFTLRRALAEGTPFQAVLMDIQMPEMDGYEATAVIRDDPALANLPVIAMTAHAMRGDRERVLAAGMDDYVTKPIEPHVLYTTLARWLPHHQPSQDTVPEPDAASAALPATLPGTLPGIDLAEGLERLLGNADLYLSVLQDLRDSYADRGKEIMCALERGDDASARGLTHALRGVAANVSAKELAASALQLQEALEATLAGDETARASLPYLGKQVETALAVVVAGLTEFLV
jgi:CheY-like chemotaxis protein/HPt (histidine-containing phosphotransfer) domain-containing protein